MKKTTVLDHYVMMVNDLCHAMTKMMTMKVYFYRHAKMIDDAPLLDEDDERSLSRDDEEDEDRRLSSRSRG